MPGRFGMDQIQMAQGAASRKLEKRAIPESLRHNLDFFAGGTHLPTHRGEALAIPETQDEDNPSAASATLNDGASTKHGAGEIPNRPRENDGQQEDQINQRNNSLQSSQREKMDSQRKSAVAQSK